MRTKNYLCRVDDETYYLEVGETNGFYIVNANCSISMDYMLKENGIVSNTILSQEDIDYLLELEKYSKGLPCFVGCTKDEKFYNDLKFILEKLESKENQEMWEQVIEEDIDYLTNTTYLTREEVLEAFENYPYEYKDKGVIMDVHSCYEDVGERYLDCLPMSYDDFDKISQWFDLYQFGKDMTDNEQFYIVDDTKIVEYNL